MRLEEESRKSKPRRRGADLRIPEEVREEPKPECGVKFHARFRRPSWARGSPRGTSRSQRRRPPRDDRGQGDRKNV
jgi:hypothetical protein